MNEFIEHYGTRGLGLLVARFIELAPEFKGDKALAEELGKAVGMLETGLEEVARDRR